MRISRLTIVIAVCVLAASGAAYWYFNQSFRTPPPPPSVASVLPKEFLLAMKEGQDGKSEAGTTSAGTTAHTGKASDSGAKLTGNGRNQMHVAVENTGDKPVPFTLTAGEIYESGNNRIVLLEGCQHQIPAHGVFQTDLRTLAISSANIPSEESYTKSSSAVPKLDALMAQIKSHAQLSPNAAQTAVLILVENPSLDIFAKFPRLHTSHVVLGDTVFKVDVVDIIAALQLLAEMGVTDRGLSSDPQLKIEAMVDARAHALAAQYYGIAQNDEWSYWKHELLEGDPTTRHYALYGIARYYPDVALKMLPKWARETKLQPIYRLSAVRALAITHRPEAIQILHDLEQEFGADTDLHQSADRATKYLTKQLSQPS